MNKTGTPPDWLCMLALLAARLSHLGVTPDLAGMSMTELEALYRFLARVAEG